MFWQYITIAVDPWLEDPFKWSVFLTSPIILYSTLSMCRYAADARRCRRGWRCGTRSSWSRCSGEYPGRRSRESFATTLTLWVTSIYLSLFNSTTENNTLKTFISHTWTCTICKFLMFLLLWPTSYKLVPSCCFEIKCLNDDEDGSYLKKNIL